MAGLQRSEVSFRRQGSSGLVWDDRFLSGELGKQQETKDDKLEMTEVKATKAIEPINTEFQRSRSNGGGRGYKTSKVPQAIEPPSPTVSACGFCSAFGKAEKKSKRTKRSQKRSR